MIHKFEPKERQLYIDFFKTIFDTALRDTTFSIAPLYITGGSCRRLYMLENNIDFHIEDVKSMLQSDIDIHSTNYDNTMNITSPLYGYYDEFKNPYDHYGLADVSLFYNYRDKTTRFFREQVHIINKLKNIMEKLEPYRKKLFGNDNHSIKEDDVKLMKMQYICITNTQQYILSRMTDDNVQKFDIKFDLDSSRFLYWNGRVYDKRMYPNSEYDYIHSTCNPFKTISRIRKFEKFGYKYDESALRQLLVKYMNEIESRIPYGASGNGLPHDDPEYGYRELDILCTHEDSVSQIIDKRKVEDIHE